MASLELLAPQPAALLGRESMVNNLQCTNGPLRPHVWKDHVYREEPVLVNILASAPRLDPEPQPENPETEGGSDFEKTDLPGFVRNARCGFSARVPVLREAPRGKRCLTQAGGNCSPRRAVINFWPGGVIHPPVLRFYAPAISALPAPGSCQIDQAGVSIPADCRPPRASPNCRPGPPPK